MTYSVEILRRARKDLGRLPPTLRERVIRAIRNLSIDPRPPGCLKLHGREGWRIRIGDHRVLYTINDERRIVTVIAVAHRGEAYR